MVQLPTGGQLPGDDMGQPPWRRGINSSSDLNTFLIAETSTRY
jgi:hypothetical protein